jgi:hypothetical protein
MDSVIPALTDSTGTEQSVKLTVLLRKDGTELLVTASMDFTESMVCVMSANQTVPGTGTSVFAWTGSIPLTASA